MGRFDSSSRRDRDRNDRRRSPDRRDRDTAEEKVSDLKQRMREGLASAAAYSSSNTTPSAVPNNLGSVSRQREIDDIEEGSFRQKSFKSTSGGAGGRVYEQKKGQLSRANRIQKIEDAHESSIFGPTKPQTIDDIHLPKDAMPEEKPLYHPNISADPQERQERWLEIWRQRRQELIFS